MTITAMSPVVRKVHVNYYLATTTAMTVALYEEGDLAPVAHDRELAEVA